MKRLSVKARVTLWYTLFMTILILGVWLILVLLSDRQISVSMQNKLETAVSEGLEDVEYEDSTGLVIEEDADMFYEGVYLILYDEEGNHIRGKLPYGLKTEQTPAFVNGKVQEISIEDSKWVFLDVYKTLGTENQEKGVWMRGILSHSEAESSLTTLIHLAMLLLPLLVILIAVGGYYITYRAFKPIETMREAAEEITESQNLTRRIQLGDGKDEIHQLANTFDRMFDRIQEAFEREKQFTSDVSHELRTPVSVIAMQAEYSLRHENPSDELRERLQVILEQSRKMTGMISQLLTLSRADQGRAKLQKEMVHLSELVEIIAEEEQERAERKNIQIYTDCEPELYMEGDETMLMRCFINLLENAIAYGKEDGAIWISLTGKNQMIQGHIRDNGIGIQEEHLNKIWERFYQVDSSRSASAGGSSGLGLSMVKWIVEAHGGEITVESRYQKGTTFHFQFPKSEKMSAEDVLE